MENTIYVGKYRKQLGMDPEHDGVIPLPTSKLRVQNVYVGISGMDEHDKPMITEVDPKITLIVQDGNFLPYIGKLSREEAKKLRDALDTMFNSSPEEPTVVVI